MTFDVAVAFQKLSPSLHRFGTVGTGREWSGRIARFHVHRTGGVQNES